MSDKVVHGLPVFCALFVDKQRHSADCALVTQNMTCTTNPPSTFFTIRKKTEAKTMFHMAVAPMRSFKSDCALGTNSIQININQIDIRA